MEKFISSFILLRHKIASYKIFFLFLLCFTFSHSSFAQTITAGNGLNKQSNEIRLGGTLLNSVTSVDFGSSNTNSSIRFFKTTSPVSQDYFTILNGGNVGIGVSLPAYKLDVGGALGLKGLSLDPSAPASGNGVLYYNSSTNKLKAYSGGAWKEILMEGDVSGTSFIQNQTNNAQTGGFWLNPGNNDAVTSLTSAGFGIGQMRFLGSTLYNLTTGSGFTTRVDGNNGMGLVTNGGIYGGGQTLQLLHLNPNGWHYLQSMGANGLYINTYPAKPIVIRTTNDALTVDANANTTIHQTLNVNSLRTNAPAPPTTGTAKMVVTDDNGLLSYQDIPSGSSGSFIQNQNTTNQVAKFKIDGSGYIYNGDNTGALNLETYALANPALTVNKGYAKFYGEQGYITYINSRGMTFNDGAGESSITHYGDVYYDTYRTHIFKKDGIQRVQIGGTYDLSVNGASSFGGDLSLSGITRKITGGFGGTVIFNQSNTGGVRLQNGNDDAAVSVGQNYSSEVSVKGSNIVFYTEQATANYRPISSLNDNNGYHALTLSSNLYVDPGTTKNGGAFISQAKHNNNGEVYETGKLQYVYNNNNISSGRLGLFLNDVEKLSLYKNGNLVVPSLAASSSSAPTTTGTTKMVVTDQNGLLSYQDISLGSGSITASNGLSATANNVMLGGMLNQNTSISSGAGGDNPQYDFTIFSRQTADAWQYNYLKASGGQFVIGNNSLNYNGNIPLLKINGYDGGYSGNAVRANCGINVDARSDAWGIDGYGGKFEYTTFTSGQAGNANRNHYGVLSIVNFTGDGSGYNAYGGYFKAVNSATGTNNNAWGVYVDAGNVFIRDIANASLNTNKFLVSDGGVVKYRTASEMLSDLGVSGGGSVSLPSNQIAYGTGNSLTGNSNLTFDGSTFAINTANLTPSSYAQYKLAVNGNAIFTRVKVRESSQWADYVFEPSYKLPTLTEVEAFIKQHKHLPEVPSAEEVKKEGIDLGDNQAVLLKKIEELTLYVIEQNKKIETLQSEVQELKKK